MSQKIELCLLGSPQVTIANSSIFGLLASKAKALLFYLTVTQRAHSRSALAALLWADVSEEQAKKNLSDVLSLSRQWLTPHLSVSRQTIAFNTASEYWLDVEVLRTTLAKLDSTADLDALEQTLELYKGDFLDGFFVREAPLFESWLAAQREQLRDLVIRGWQFLADQYLARQDYQKGVQATQRLLTTAPWHEPAHRQQMLLLALSGQRGFALAQYQRCQQILSDELDIRPSDETTALYEQIRAGLIPPSSQPFLSQASSSTLQSAHRMSSAMHGVGQEHPSPAARAEEQSQGSSFYAVPAPIQLLGRQAELTKLQKWLSSDHCRLIGLFGIPGHGKTSLVAKAVHLLHEAASTHSDGAPYTHMIWSSLNSAPRPLEKVYFWLRQLGDRISLTPASFADPSSTYLMDELVTRLLDMLRRQRCLLVLDDVESITEETHWAGYLRSGYERYGEIFQRIVESDHQSTLLLIGRERLQAFNQWEEQTPAVQSLQLEGIDVEAGVEYLNRLGLNGAPEALRNLVRRYDGHVLSLQVIAETAHEFFAGDLTPFIQDEIPVLDSVETLLTQQLSRLTPAEQRILHWFRADCRPFTLQELGTRLHGELALGIGLSAVRSLLRRGLLERKATTIAPTALVQAYLQQQSIQAAQRTTLPKLLFPSSQLPFETILQ